jgi:hypothetical protein
VITEEITMQKRLSASEAELIAALRFAAWATSTPRGDVAGRRDEIAATIRKCLHDALYLESSNDAEIGRLLLPEEVRALYRAPVRQVNSPR